MSEPKIYCGSGKVINTQYGQFMKLSLLAEDLNTIGEHLDNGWVNLNVMERREPKYNEEGKITATHYICIDTWKPQTIKEAVFSAQEAAPDDPEDELPF